MKKFAVLAVAILIVAVCAPAVAQQIAGDYVETRSADIYTGQCFANGEVGLTGNEAILGWRVRHGAWNGVALDGLAIAAAVRAKATLGDPYADPYPAKAVLIVDDQATPQQRQALVSFAAHMGGRLLENVEKVIAAPVALEMSPEHHGRALLRAGQFAVVQTRGINEHDHLCGNEYTFYPPLTASPWFYIGLVLVVAAVNVTNLRLVSTSLRRRELAVRAVLGAGQGRLARLLLTKSLILATLGKLNAESFYDEAVRIAALRDSEAFLAARFKDRGFRVEKLLLRNFQYADAARPVPSSIS